VALFYFILCLKRLLPEPELPVEKKEPDNAASVVGKALLNSLGSILGGSGGAAAVPAVKSK
jgi:hypothetical protein